MVRAVILVITVIATSNECNTGKSSNAVFVVVVVVVVVVVCFFVFVFCSFKPNRHTSKKAVAC